ncbi:hypothetical protein MNBD_CHLOROFLEXI01-4273 [hydrothermal vent metagenome]|uniref:Four helix bundle protein n=1 Tax=hydrothermal vent metagenome TaxID=652676 RepID=A0A3B0UVA8_9ZZZZ
MDKKQFQQRTKMLGIRIIKMTEAMPNRRAADIVARQIIRSSTSVGSNYRAACRARSTADMINKLKTVEEEADETLFWLEVIIETEMMSQDKLKALQKEADEILAMTIASIKTLRRRKS